MALDIARHEWAFRYHLQAALAHVRQRGLDQYAGQSAPLEVFRHDSMDERDRLAARFLISDSDSPFGVELIALSRFVVGDLVRHIHSEKCRYKPTL